MLARSRTFTLIGVAAEEVQVEVDVNPGLPAFWLVGLPDAAVRESRERVRSATANCGFEFPMRRITASLAPADVRKAGPAFDLAIAGALLAASGQLSPALLDRYALAGELALDGTVRPVHGVLAMAEAARERGLGGLAVAAANAREAALVAGLEVVALERLDQLAAWDRGEWTPPPVTPAAAPSSNGRGPDLGDVRGQPFLCRALKVAAAGGHHMLIVGPPGSGKTMAARRLPSILPELGLDEALEVTRIASACGRPPPAGRLASRPFRAPHHSVSHAGLVGGGNPPVAGEITIAHGGVLFLDELGEFSRAALEALRQPLEDGEVVISRAGHRVTLPCRFMLMAAANPCPCGHGAGRGGRCRCTPVGIERYHAKLSGPLADRIDISLAVDQPSPEALAGPPGETSAEAREQVTAARQVQARRLGPGRLNGRMEPAEAREHCRLDPGAGALLAESHRALGLSGRGRDRVLRVARTLADLEAAERISAMHLAEAISLRGKAGAW